MASPLKAEKAQKQKQQAAAKRTAWIIAAIAAAFFIASLVQGHFAQIQHW